MINDYILLPKLMAPNKESYIEAGFVFVGDVESTSKYIQGKSIFDKLQKVILPDGWYEEYNNETHESNIIDQDGNIRVVVYINAESNTAYMTMQRKYYIDEEIEEIDGEKYWTIFFGNKEEKIFVGGTIKQPNFKKCTQKEINAFNLVGATLTAQTYRYAMDNYPEYNDPNAYWNKEKTLK